MPKNLMKIEPNKLESEPPTSTLAVQIGLEFNPESTDEGLALKLLSLKFDCAH
jgi:hypothetical protein